MIYLDACALLKFIKREKESDTLRAWRTGLPDGTDLVTSELARLEISRTLLRAGVDHQRVPYFATLALQGLYVVDVTHNVFARAATFQTPRLGSLDAVHLATAYPLRKQLTGFVTYDRELTEAVAAVGISVCAPAPAS